MTNCNYTAIKNIPQPNKPKGCRIPLTKNEFLFMAVTKHGNKYDYSLVPLTGIKKKGKVPIICKKCGHYFEQVVSLHVVRGDGCAVCAGRRPRTLDIFIDEARAIHGNKYDYSLAEYMGSNEKITIVCNSCHARFTPTPSSHIHGKTGCRKCSAKALGKRQSSNATEFAMKAKSIHGEKYSYDKVEYVTALKKVIITCHTHGDFKIRPNDILKGQGCAKCARNSSVGFSKARFVRACSEKNRVAKLYLVKMTNDLEVFYKVGITSRSVSQRLREGGICYECEIVFEVHEQAAFIYDLEKRIHKLLSKYRYNPLIPFAGSAKECFHKIPKPVSSLLMSIEKSKQINLLT